MHSGPKHDDNFENNMGGSIIYSGGGIGITADPGQNSYDPPLNDLFETDRNSYDPPPKSHINIRERTLETGRGGSFPDFRRSENRPPLPKTRSEYCSPPPKTRSEYRPFPLPIRYQ